MGRARLTKISASVQNCSRVPHLRLAPVSTKWCPGSKGSAHSNTTNLQPVPARYPAARFGFGDPKGPARN
jgi:hypothetical protein